MYEYSYYEFLIRTTNFFEDDEFHGKFVKFVHEFHEFFTCTTKFVTKFVDELTSAMVAVAALVVVAAVVVVSVVVVLVAAEVLAVAPRTRRSTPPCGPR